MIAGAVLEETEWGELTAKTIGDTTGDSSMWNTARQVVERALIIGFKSEQSAIVWRKLLEGAATALTAKRVPFIGEFSRQFTGLPVVATSFRELPEGAKRVLLSSVLAEFESATGYLIGERTGTLTVRAEVSRISPFHSFRPVAGAVCLAADCETDAYTWASAGLPMETVETKPAVEADPMANPPVAGSPAETEERIVVGSDRRVPVDAGRRYRFSIRIGDAGHPPANAIESCLRLAAYRFERPDARNAWANSGARDAARAFQRGGLGL